MGSWLLYGLGAEAEDLPGFIVLNSAGRTGLQPVSARQWSSGFLPSRFQGVQFQSKGDPVHYVGNPEGVCQSTQRQVVEEIKRMNGILAEDHLDPEIQTRISQLELAFKMQTSIPELVDLRNEPQHILDLYGVKKPGDGSFASNCLLARRLAERGVRFVQLFHRGWDQHTNLPRDIRKQCDATDQASAALIRDLKQRGMLDDTLVVWGGEFGRTVYCQGTLTADNYGRDHHPRCFTMWLAGGGIKPGLTYGTTDDFCYNVAENPVHVHDLHATLLHLLGIDHRKLTYKFQGRYFRLTDVHGRIVHDILA